MKPFTHSARSVSARSRRARSALIGGKSALSSPCAKIEVVLPFHTPRQTSLSNDAPELAHRRLPRLPTRDDIFGRDTPFRPLFVPFSSLIHAEGYALLRAPLEDAARRHLTAYPETLRNETHPNPKPIATRDMMTAIIAIANPDERSRCRPVL